MLSIGDSAGETTMKRQELRRRALEYLRARALELRDMSAANEAKTLAYLFDMAALEANIVPADQTHG
jgi:hypothetical protein